MIISDEDLDDLAAIAPEKRAAAILLNLFAAGLLDDDAYAQAIIRADDDVRDFGGGALCS